MSDVVTFEFYSDTNQANALDELEGLALDYLVNGIGFIEVGFEDFQAMGDSIETIVEANGGHMVD